MGPQETFSHNIFISNVNPADESTGISITPTLQASIFDTIGSPVQWSIRSNASGLWTTVTTGTLATGSGTISGTNAAMNNYETSYYWSVNATDGILWANETYQFTTGIGKPIISDVLPLNEAIYIGLEPTLQATITDLQGDLVNWWIKTNASGVWSTVASGNLPTGAGTISGTSLDMNDYQTTYYWSINANDGVRWTNQTYTFKTKPFIPGVVEDFDTSFTTGQRVGTHPDWYDGGSGPLVTQYSGIAGSNGLTPANHTFIWAAHAFNWNDADFQKINLQMDFATDQYGLFDNDRIGWITTNTNTNTDNFFGIQIQPRGSVINIEGYWDHAIGVDKDKRPHIVDLPTLDGIS